MSTKSLLLGTLCGGLAAFVWSSISWGVLGWHEKTMLGFQRDEEVAAVISSHTLQDGTYLLPYASPPDANLTARMERGPIVVAAVRRGGFGSFPRAMIAQALSLFAAAFLLTWLLLQPAASAMAAACCFWRWWDCPRV